MILMQLGRVLWLRGLHEHAMQCFCSVMQHKTGSKHSEQILKDETLAWVNRSQTWLDLGLEYASCGEHLAAINRDALTVTFHVQLL